MTVRSMLLTKKQKQKLSDTMDTKQAISVCRVAMADGGREKVEDGSGGGGKGRGFER